MKIIKKIADNTRTLEGVTLAFLGDSVTQGCFELYKNASGGVSTVFDQQSSYEMTVLKILNTFFPTVPINIINAGASGGKAAKGLERVERDVIRHAPDLTVVCFGLNDCKAKYSKVESENIKAYVAALEGIFTKLQSAGIEVLFMTPNMMNTAISPHLTDPSFIKVAETCADFQTRGVLEAHLTAAKELCRKMGIPVCDCYAIWKKLYESGVNTNELLSNKINHPTREMNKLFAIELVRTMFTEE
ncbi:MAG: GDSL family lipase [Clostridia bacterium]|nr:GDSL family lipase [Clostridia bacterium]